MASNKSKDNHSSLLKEETWWTMQRVKSKMGSDAKQSASVANTNRVLPVNCSNFHSIELRAGKLSIWCRRLLCLRRDLTAVSEVEETGRRRRREKEENIFGEILETFHVNIEIYENFLLSSVRTASATSAVNDSPSQTFLKARNFHANASHSHLGSIRS